MVYAILAKGITLSFILCKVPITAKRTPEGIEETWRWFQECHNATRQSASRQIQLFIDWTRREL